MIHPTVEPRNIQLILPPDLWWLLRVQVPHDRDCVPFQFWILWHFQWMAPREFNA